jgi:hypothetical protein
MDDCLKESSNFHHSQYCCLQKILLTFTTYVQNIKWHHLDLQSGLDWENLKKQQYPTWHLCWSWEAAWESGLTGRICFMKGSRTHPQNLFGESSPTFSRICYINHIWLLNSRKMEKTLWNPNPEQQRRIIIGKRKAWSWRWVASEALDAATSRSSCWWPVKMRSNGS